MADSRRWWVLGALALALLTIGLDVTVLNVALPTLATEIDASTSDLQWIAGSYTLVLAVGVLPAGVLGDRFGSKRLLLLALTIFGLASGGCALATSPGQLIAARAALGIGAALMIPLSMSLLTRLFHGAERIRAITIWTMAMAIGLPLGPIVGGLLLEHVAWPAVFLINLPLVVVGLLAIAVLVPAIPGSHTNPVDLLGLLLSSAGLGLLTYGVIESGRRGWGDPLVAAAVGVGASLLVGLALRIRLARFPLVARALVRSRAFSTGALSATVGSFLLTAAMFLVPQFSHSVLGADAIATGLQLLPAIGGLLIGAKVAESLVHRLGATRVVAGGFLVAALGLGVGGMADLGAGYGAAAGWIALIGVGVGGTLPPSMDLAMGSLTASASGSGSAALQAVRQTGSTLGIALVGSLLSAGYLARIDTTGLADPAREMVRGGAAGGVMVAKAAGSSELLGAVRGAFLHGMSQALWACTAAAVVGAVFAWRFLPARPDDAAGPGVGTAGPEPEYSKDDHAAVRTPRA